MIKKHKRQWKQVFTLIPKSLSNSNLSISTCKVPAHILFSSWTLSNSSCVCNRTDESMRAHTHTKHNTHAHADFFFFLQIFLTDTWRLPILASNNNNEYFYTHKPPKRGTHSANKTQHFCPFDQLIYSDVYCKIEKSYTQTHLSNQPIHSNAHSNLLWLLHRLERWVLKTF